VSQHHRSFSPAARTASTLLPGLSQRDGTCGCRRPRPPWLTHVRRRRPVAAASPSAEAAETSRARATGTQAAHPVHGPSAGCGQRDQDGVRDDCPGEHAPPPAPAGARRPPAGDRRASPGRRPPRRTPHARPGQYSGRARRLGRTAESAQVVPSQRLAHEHDDRRQGDDRQRDRPGEHPASRGPSVPDPMPSHHSIVRECWPSDPLWVVTLSANRKIIQIALPSLVWPGRRPGESRPQVSGRLGGTTSGPAMLGRWRRPSEQQRRLTFASSKRPASRPAAPGARRLYERLGYVIIDQHEHHWLRSIRPQERFRPRERPIPGSCGSSWPE
jgi:hypothetical protein